MLDDLLHKENVHILQAFIDRGNISIRSQSFPTGIGTVCNHNLKVHITNVEFTILLFCYDSRLNSLLCSQWHLIWFQYIDDALSINNITFHLYVHLIYTSKQEIKGTKESSISASYMYLEFLLKRDIYGKLTILYEKRSDFKFSIVNFPNLWSNIPSSPAYGLHMS